MHETVRIRAANICANLCMNWLADLHWNYSISQLCSSIHWFIYYWMYLRVIFITLLFLILCKFSLKLTTEALELEFGQILSWKLKQIRECLDHLPRLWNSSATVFKLWSYLLCLLRIDCFKEYQATSLITWLNLISNFSITTKLLEKKKRTDKKRTYTELHSSCIFSIIRSCIKSVVSILSFRMLFMTIFTRPKSS